MSVQLEVPDGSGVGAQTARRFCVRPKSMQARIKVRSPVTEVSGRKKVGGVHDPYDTHPALGSASITRNHKSAPSGEAANDTTI